jgi:hypothetical protein
VGGAGADTIALHTTSATTIATHGTGWTVVDVVRVNLSQDLSGTTTYSNGDVITGFLTATDVIDFTGVTLLAAGGASLSLVSAATAGDTGTGRLKLRNGRFQQLLRHLLRRAKR